MSSPSAHHPHIRIKIKHGDKHAEQPHSINNNQLKKSASAKLVNGEQHALLSCYKRLADVVPAPNYDNITDLVAFEQCIDILELHDLPQEMANDSSPFKLYDVSKRINNVRKAVNNPALAKRCRNLIVKWKNAIQEFSNRGAGSSLKPDRNSVAAAHQLPHSSATSSPAVVGTTDSPAHLSNGIASVMSPPVAATAATQRKVLPLKIKFNPLVAADTTYKLQNGGALLPHSRPPTPGDSLNLVVPGSSGKRPFVEDDYQPLPDVATEPEKNKNVASLEPPVSYKKLKPLKVKPVRRRRIDLPDDDDSDSDADDVANDEKKSLSVLSVFPQLKQKLINILSALPPLDADNQHANAECFATFYAQQERDAAIYHEQQQARLAAERLAAASYETAEHGGATSKTISLGNSKGLEMIHSLKGSGSKTNNHNNNNSVINADDSAADGDDDDDDDFGFGLDELLTTLSEKPSGLSDSTDRTTKDGIFNPPSDFNKSSGVSDFDAGITTTAPLPIIVKNDFCMSYAGSELVPPPLAEGFVQFTTTRVVPPESAGMAEQNIQPLSIDADVMLTAHDDIAMDTDTAADTVAVDDKFLTLLHTQNISGCNGHYDAETHRWHNWTDAYVSRRSDGKLIGIAPYVLL